MKPNGALFLALVALTLSACEATRGPGPTLAGPMPPGYTGASKNTDNATTDDSPAKATGIDYLGRQYRGNGN